MSRGTVFTGLLAGVLLAGSRVPEVFTGSGHADTPVPVVNTRVGVNYEYEFRRGPVRFTVAGNVINASVR